ncbi:SMC-Scp complex subunit ScpB [candidate division WOR-3 bacterium]|uniref:SMC-Scp complex subunit ScpB n=1 Tax=candidate division WOR-3 bacterium TaxID=2052148 RepID=A0A937XFW8_UNCW3|nr:SMC-Scp complex subunit ScpB [candidate division WOR-3 bacterium]
MMEEKPAAGVESRESGVAGAEPGGVAPESEIPTPRPKPLHPGALEPAPQSLAPDPVSPLSTPESDDSSLDNRHSEIPAPAPLPAVQVLEALLFAADAPVKLDRLAELAEVEPEEARAVIDGLNAVYQETGRTFRVQRVAQGFQLYTMPDYAEFVRRLYQHQYTHRLSRAALEVMAIIAYKQPVTRPEIEQLRGVDCSGPLVTLLERRLIATYGRASRPGNPFLYRTTPEFLRYFGLAGLEDLPRMEEIGEFLARRETGTTGSVPEKDVTFDSLAMDGGHRDGAPDDAR